jgi:hypothetical protein
MPFEMHLTDPADRRVKTTSQDRRGWTIGTSGDP